MSLVVSGDISAKHLSRDSCAKAVSKESLEVPSSKWTEMFHADARCEREQPFVPRTMCMDDLDQLMLLSALSSGTSDSEEAESDDGDNDDDDRDWDGASNPTDRESEMQESEDWDSDSFCTEQGSWPDRRDDDLFDCLLELSGLDSCTEFAMREQQRLGDRSEEHCNPCLKHALMSTHHDQRSAVEVSHQPDVNIRLHDKAGNAGHNSESKSGVCPSLEDVLQQEENLHFDSDSLRANCAEFAFHDGPRSEELKENRDVTTGRFCSSDVSEDQPSRLAHADWMLAGDCTSMPARKRTALRA